MLSELDAGMTSLLQRISAGDEKAFRRLFDLYYEKLLHVAFYFLRSRSFAEEAVSDVFLIVWKRRETLTAIRDIEHYLYIAVKHQALHYLRRGVVSDMDFAELYQTDFVEEADNPELILLDKEYQSLICQAINALPEKCREVFRLVISDKLKHREIASLLSISEKTVEAHITRAYKAIASYVKTEYAGKAKNKHHL